MTTVSPPSFSKTSHADNDDQDDNRIVTFRGPCIENTHFVHIAVVSSSGSLTHYTGNPNRITLVRSALKPIQALAILSTGAGQLFSFDDADIALLCASHSSEPRHTSRARAMLSRTAVNEDVLTCGGHPALNPDVNRDWVKTDFVPTGIHNNCSGKHAGMIAGALALGEKAEGYEKSDHPMQKIVQSVVESMSGCGKRELGWGIDGCNLPAPAMPLVGLARMFVRVAGARDGVEPNGLDWNGVGKAEDRMKHLSRIFDVMTTYPGLVAGEARFCTDLMTAYKGLLIGKVGADGCYAIGVRAASPSDDSQGHGAIGIAVKIEDGNLDILYAAIPEILQKLCIGTPEMGRQMGKWRLPVMKNTASVVTGRVEHHFRLKKVGEEVVHIA